jgi:hypothetical protein
VPLEHVVFLDNAPTDRKYRLIGYVSPPIRKFHSWGESLNAVRAAASLYGADAVFLDSQKELEGWGFSASQYGASGGKWRDVQIRAKAIVWEQ